MQRCRKLRRSAGSAYIIKLHGKKIWRPNKIETKSRVSRMGIDRQVIWKSFMKYSESLKKNTDFKKVYKEGKSKANRYLVLYVRKNSLEKNRIGISVSKKVGNSVVRHTLTRKIREAYRLNEEKFAVGYDMVVVVRVRGKDCTYFEIERAICHLGGMHHLLKEENPSENEKSGN